MNKMYWIFALRTETFAQLVEVCHMGYWGLNLEVRGTAGKLRYQKSNLRPLDGETYINTVITIRI